MIKQPKAKIFVFKTQQPVPYTYTKDDSYYLRSVGHNYRDAVAGLLYKSWVDLSGKQHVLGAVEHCGTYALGEAWWDKL